MTSYFLTHGTLRISAWKIESENSFSFIFSYQTPPSSTDNEVRIVFECFRKKYRTALAFSGLLCATLDIFAHFWARAFDNCAMKIIYLARGTLNTASKSFFLRNCKIKMFLYHESITVNYSTTKWFWFFVFLKKHEYGAGESGIWICTHFELHYKLCALELALMVELHSTLCSNFTRHITLTFSESNNVS